MKNTLILFLLSVILGGCKEENTPEVLSEDIIGKWLWTGTGGGLGGGYGKKPRADEKTVLHFNSLGEFLLTKNDSIILQGKYRVDSFRSIYGVKQGLFYEETKNNKPIPYSYVVIGPAILSLTNKSLSIGDNAYDGFGSNFTKVK